MHWIALPLTALLFATSLAAADPPRSERLVTVYEDSMGHLLKTREVTVFRTGEVTEEAYNFSSDKTEPVHRKRRLKTLSKQVVARIQALLAENGFEQLPSVINLSDGIVPDAPFRMIRTYSGKREHSVHWNSYSDDPKTHEAVRFTAVFRELMELAAPAPSNSALHRARTGVLLCCRDLYFIASPVRAGEL